MLKKDLIVLVVVVVVVDMTSGSSKKPVGFKLQSNLHLWPPLHNDRLSTMHVHISTMAIYLCPGRQSIQCFIFKPLDNGHLSKRAMAQQPVFSVTDGMESQEWS